MSVIARICVFAGVYLASLPGFATDLPAVHVAENHGFVDVDVPISDVIQESGLVRVIARGSVDGDPVGLEVDFPTKPTQPGLPPLLRSGTARIRTLGADSNRFVIFLSKQYGVSSTPPKMIASVDASAVGLGEDTAR